MAAVKKKMPSRGRAATRGRGKRAPGVKPAETLAANIEDDVYAIHVGQSEYREAFNTGDVERLLRVFAPAFTDMSEGVPSFYDEDAPIILQRRMGLLFEKFRAYLGQAVMRVQVFGDMAYSFGLRELMLEPKDGGAARKANFRFFELWSKDEKGNWKLQMVMDNAEPPVALPEVELAVPWFGMKEAGGGC